jgi:polysaccharide biosynthesis/export protein
MITKTLTGQIRTIAHCGLLAVGIVVLASAVASAQISGPGPDAGSSSGNPYGGYPANSTIGTGAAPEQMGAVQISNGSFTCPNNVQPYQGQNGWVCPNTQQPGAFTCPNNAQPFQGPNGGWVCANTQQPGAPGSASGYSGVGSAAISGAGAYAPSAPGLPGTSGYAMPANSGSGYAPGYGAPNVNPNAGTYTGMPSRGGTAPGLAGPMPGGFGPLTGTMSGGPFAPAATSPGAGAFGSLAAPSGTAPTGLPMGVGPSASTLSAIANGTDQNTLNAVAAQLGVSGDQLQNLRTQISNGNVSSDQMQQLSARFGALNLSDGQMMGIAQSLGLSEQQLNQVRATISATRGAPGQIFAQPQPGQMGAVQSGNGSFTCPNNVQPFQSQNGWVCPNTNTQQPTMAGPSVVPLSAIENKFQQLDNPLQVPETPTAANLAQFGYNIFANPVSTFAPIGNVPVGDDYVIGPGDTLNVLEWGRINQTLLLLVDRDGMVQMDQIGPIQLAGLTFGQAKKSIENKATKITGVSVDVTMGQLRTIQVYITGEVNMPGAYTVSALSRVSNALVAAGGISKVGSLRDIELRHGNQLVGVIDLYDLLLHGKNNADRRLEEGDVIFVPVIGSVVAVAGDVKRAAIYELDKNRPEDLRQAIRLAGGASAFSYFGRLQVDRVENHKKQIALDIKLSQLTTQNFGVRDGDVIKIYGILPGLTNTVMIDGNVHRPGEFQWFKGMRVSDLVNRAEGILPHTYFRYALIKRFSGPEKHTHFVQVNLGAALGNRRVSPGDILLQPKDSLSIYSEDMLKDMPGVEAVGMVRMPGRFVLMHDMKVSDLVYLAGGLRDGAYTGRVQLVRSQVVAGGKNVRSSIDLNLQAIMDGDFSHDIVLKPNDELYVRNVLDWNRPPQLVTIDGEVRQPGMYDYHSGMRVNDLVALAGGVKDDAFLEQAELARTEVVNGSKTLHTYMGVDLRQALTGANQQNPLLKADDELLIKSASGYHLPWTVELAGRVARPGIYSIHGQESLDSVLSRAGGFMPDAFPQGIVFTRVTVKKLEQDTLDQARSRLQQEVAQLAMMQNQLATTASSTSNSNQNGYVSTLMLLQNVLTTAQNEQAQGRVIIDYSGKLAGGASQNLMMEDGDRIDVPKRPSSISVLGEVYNPGSFLCLSAFSVADYINRAGSYTSYADRKNVMVIKADGSVWTKDGFDDRSRLFPMLPLVGGGLMGARLQPGDTVFVPVKLDNLQNLQVAKDVTQIISQSAMGLAVVGLLATKL